MTTDSQNPKSNPILGKGFEEAYNLVVSEIKQLEQAQRDIGMKLAEAKSARDTLLRLRPRHTAPPGRNRRAKGVAMESKPIKHHKGSLTGEIVKRSKLILIASGRPLERSELLEEIERSGFRVDAKHPARFVGRALWASKDFIHLPKKGYWVKGEELPEIE
ncbi:hypothetical protein ACCS54_19515 [Rhizobium johnstonii]|jgi:hypothetical protein|uniref:hypothetical protein n=1 Tax=Rhizobium TaxID=379 RepID=UPI00140FCF41|nr:hypothetical protein [Rhizobium leguminosarum]QIO64079.1 hypothetical protein HA462_03020 [Rhizobium leguminosarum bv. trifolii]